MLSKFSSIFSCWELQFRAEFMVRAPDLLLLDSVPRVELLWLNVYCISWMLGRSIWCLHDTVAWQLASQTRDVFIFPVTLGSNSILLLNCDFFLISNMNADVVKASNLRCITASIPCLCFFFKLVLLCIHTTCTQLRAWRTLRSWWTMGYNVNSFNILQLWYKVWCWTMFDDAVSQA